MFSFCLFRKILLDILDLCLIFRCHLHLERNLNRLSKSNILVLSHFFSCNIKMKEEIWSVWNQNQLNHLQSFLQWICGFDLFLLKCMNIFEEIFQKSIISCIYIRKYRKIGWLRNKSILRKLSNCSTKRNS